VFSPAQNGGIIPLSVRRRHSPRAAEGRARKEVFAMEFRVMDEAAVFEGRGLALLVNEGDSAAFAGGCRIRDIRGNVHTVEAVSSEEDITILYLRDGDADYFGRLFRNVLVDATLFTLLTDGSAHGA
jgi:hypothetical protein